MCVLMYHMYLIYVIKWLLVLIHCGYTYNDTFCFPLDNSQGGRTTQGGTYEFYYLINLHLLPSPLKSTYVL